MLLRWLVAILVGALASGCCCGVLPVSHPDACETDADCEDDGDFCNGAERCDPSVWGGRYCVSRGNPCWPGWCDPYGERCLECEPGDGAPECPRDAGPAPPSCDPTVQGAVIGSSCTDTCSAASDLVCIEGETTSVGPVRVRWRSMCSEICFSSAECGSCGRCDETVRVGDVHVLAWEVARQPLCRPTCEPRFDARGCARAGYSCDVVTGTCHDVCASDLECRVVIDATGALVVDETRLHVCDRTTGRCRVRGTDGARVGDPCAVDTDCMDDGFCLRGDGWPAEGYCTRVDCQWAALECDEGQQCHRRVTSRPACLHACTVGAEPEDARVGVDGHGEGCAPGLACRWDGISSGAGPNGGCMPGNYNAVAAPNLGAPCAGDDECHSPHGLGRCAWAELGMGTCTVLDCATRADGSIGLLGGGADTPELCDPLISACVRLEDGSRCALRCEVATDCADGYACVEGFEGSVCLPSCTEDAQCRAGERCDGPASCARSSECRCIPA